MRKTLLYIISVLLLILLLIYYQTSKPAIQPPLNTPHSDPLTSIGYIKLTPGSNFVDVFNTVKQGDYNIKVYFYPYTYHNFSPPNITKKIIFNNDNSPITIGDEIKNQFISESDIVTELDKVIEMFELPPFVIFPVGTALRIQARNNENYPVYVWVNTSRPTSVPRITIPPGTISTQSVITPITTNYPSVLTPITTTLPTITIQPSILTTPPITTTQPVITTTLPIITTQPSILTTPPIITTTLPITTTQPSINTPLATTQPPILTTPAPISLEKLMTFSNRSIRNISKDQYITGQFVNNSNINTQLGSAGATKFNYSSNIISYSNIFSGTWYIGYEGDLLKAYSSQRSGVIILYIYSINNTSNYIISTEFYSSQTQSLRIVELKPDNSLGIVSVNINQSSGGISDNNLNDNHKWILV